MRTFLAIGLFASLPFSSAHAAEPDLAPPDTYAVVAGVLQWPGNRIGGFPTKNRKDEELYEVLRKKGIPPENMKLLLDEEATYSGVKRAIQSIAGKAPAGSTLIVYYCGHGMPAGKGGQLCLANYDLMPQRADLTGLLASDLAGMVKSNFKGRKVLFLADCCYSGGLNQAAKSLRDAGFETAAVTSSNDKTTSTVNWTYTQTVIDVLRGDSFADANGDGFVSLDELNAEVRAAMHALERQTSGFASYGWSGKYNVSTANAKAKKTGTPFSTGDYVFVPSQNRAGRILDAADGKCAVQFYDYTEKKRTEFAVENLKPLPEGWGNRSKSFAVVPKGEFEVEWEGQWYAATAVKKDGERTLVHYVGWSDAYDEWVTKERIRAYPKPPAATPGPMPRP